MLQTQIGKTILNIALILVDMQNDFLSKGSSYDKESSQLLGTFCPQS
jgi:hypothetical protein